MNIKILIYHNSVHLYFSRITEMPQVFLNATKIRAIMPLPLEMFLQRKPRDF